MADHTEYLNRRRFLPLVIWITCAAFLILGFVLPKGDQGEIIGYEYRCGVEFDRGPRCADVPVYADASSGPFRYSSFLTILAMFLGVGALVWWFQWNSAYKDHIHIITGRDPDDKYVATDLLQAEKEALETYDRLRAQWPERPDRFSKAATLEITEARERLDNVHENIARAKQRGKRQYGGI